MNGFRINRLAAAESAELYIYDEIGYFGIDAKAAAEEIKALGSVKRLSVRINSPGGVISDGIAIYNAIKRTGAEVTCYVDGLAASIASVIAMAGSSRVMAEGSLMMIHNPWSFCIGGSDAMRKEADVLDLHKQTIVGIYENATGKSRDELSSLMDAETWMRGQSAVDMGFANSVEGEVKAAACLRREALAQWYAQAPVEQLKDFIKDGSQPADTSTADPVATDFGAAPRSLYERHLALREREININR